MQFEVGSRVKIGKDAGEITEIDAPQSRANVKMDSGHALRVDLCLLVPESRFVPYHEVLTKAKQGARNKARFPERDK